MGLISRLLDGPLICPNGHCQLEDVSLRRNQRLLSTLESARSHLDNGDPSHVLKLPRLALGESQVVIPLGLVYHALPQPRHYRSFHASWQTKHMLTCQHEVASFDIALIMFVDLDI